MVDRLHEMEAQVANTHELSKARWDAENRKGEWSEEKLSAPERNALSGISSSRIKYREGIEQAQATIDRLERVIAAPVGMLASRSVLILSAVSALHSRSYHPLQAVDRRLCLFDTFPILDPRTADPTERIPLRRRQLLFRPLAFTVLSIPTRLGQFVRIGDLCLHLV